MTDIKDDEWIVLEEFRKAKRDRFADMLISVDSGELAKVYVTRKLQGQALKVHSRRLKEDNHVDVAG